MLASKSETNDELQWIRSRLSDRYKGEALQAAVDFGQWDEETKIDFVEEVLSRMCHSQLRQVNLILKPILQRDFISSFVNDTNFNIAEKILGYLDAESLINADEVSPEWRCAISKGQIWKKLIEHKIKTDSIWYKLIRKIGLSFYFDIPIRETTSKQFSDGTYVPDNQTDCTPEPALLETGVSSAQLNHDSAVHNKSTPPRNLIQRAQVVRDSDYYRELYPKLIFLIDRINRNWREGRVKIHKINCESELNKGVYCLQYDDLKIVSGLRDNTIKIWDRATLECRSVLRGHNGSVLCLQYDDCLIISGSSDATVRVWCVHTGRELSVLEYHREAVLHLKFHKNTLVTCSKDYTVAVWTIEFPNSIVFKKSLTAHRAAVNVVDLDDNYIVSASGDRTIRVWDAQSYQLVRTLTGHKRGIACLQYRDRLIVSGSSDNTIRLWDVEQGTCLRTMEGHDELVRCIRMDSRYIVSGAYDGKIKVWDLQAALDPQSHPDSLCIANLCEHTGRVFRLQFDEFQIVSSSHDDSIVIWDFFDMEPTELRQLLMNEAAGVSDVELLEHEAGEKDALCASATNLDSKANLSCRMVVSPAQEYSATVKMDASEAAKRASVDLTTADSDVHVPQQQHQLVDWMVSLMNGNARNGLKPRTNVNFSSPSGEQHRRRVRSSSTISLLTSRPLHSSGTGDSASSKPGPSTSTDAHLRPQHHHHRLSKSAARSSKNPSSSLTLEDSQLMSVSQEAPGSAYVSLTTNDPSILGARFPPRGLTLLNMPNETAGVSKMKHEDGRSVLSVASKQLAPGSGTRSSARQIHMSAQQHQQQHREEEDNTFEQTPNNSSQRDPSLF